MSQEIPQRDVVETETEAESEAQTQDWRSFKGVVESTVIETSDRLNIVAGVNQYKGNYYVFLAKVTDKNFARSFFMMPAFLWEKALPIVSQYVAKIGEIEKQALAKQVIEELKRLQALGIDVKALAQQL